MKKLIALIAAIAVMMSMTVVSFASFDTEITLNADGKYTAALPEAAATANAGKQTTIVAYKGDTIAVGSIQYINQDAQTSFDFLLKDALTADVKVVMGGEAIDKQEIGTIKYVEATKKMTVAGTVSFVGTTLPSVNLVAGETSIPAIVTATETAGLANFTAEVDEATYSVVASKLSHLGYTYNGVAASKSDIAAKLIPGDMNADNIANVDDIILVVNNYDAATGATNYQKAYDMDESGIINVDDIILVVNNYDAVPTVVSAQ